MILPKSPTKTLQEKDDDDHGLMVGRKIITKDSKATSTTNALIDCTNTFVMSSCNTSLAKPVQHAQLPAEVEFRQTKQKDTKKMKVLPVEETMLLRQASGRGGEGMEVTAKSLAKDVTDWDFEVQNNDYSGDFEDALSLPSFGDISAISGSGSFFVDDDDNNNNENTDNITTIAGKKEEENLVTFSLDYGENDNDSANYSLDSWVASRFQIYDEIRIKLKIQNSSFSDEINTSAKNELTTKTSMPSSLQNDALYIIMPGVYKNSRCTTNKIQHEKIVDKKRKPFQHVSNRNSKSRFVSEEKKEGQQEEKKSRQEKMMLTKKLPLCQPTQYENEMELSTQLRSDCGRKEVNSTKLFNNESDITRRKGRFYYETWSNSIKCCHGVGNQNDEEEDDDKCSDYHLRKVSLLEQVTLPDNEDEDEEKDMINTTKEDKIVLSGFYSDENDNRECPFTLSTCAPLNCTTHKTQYDPHNNDHNKKKDEDGDDCSNWSYNSSMNLPFSILGCSSGQGVPYVLSPQLMESIRCFFPYSKMNDNFLLKYSMVRDGASMFTFLQKARGSRYSILAIETVNGEVFGAFTSSCWRKTWNSYGNGESFLWKLRKPRSPLLSSLSSSSSSLSRMDNGEYFEISNEAQHERGQREGQQTESEIEVFPFSGDNDMVQICTHNKIAVGGGNTPSLERFSSSSMTTNDIFEPHKCGYGLCIERDMRYGTSSPCITFSSPSLSKYHSDGSLFEIRNIELWSLTPCITEEHATQLEMGMMFLDELQTKRTI